MTIWLIIFLVLTDSHRVLSQSKLVVNTTCLELVKPSNQLFRLTCSQYNYHCLLDETFTKEFEVCIEWRWIYGGKCAYFNSYGRGNIDQTNCVRKTNLTCSNGTDEFSSVNNTKYTACYVKKETSPPVTTIPTGTQSVEGNQTVNRTFDGGNVRSVSTTSDKYYQIAGRALPIILGIIVPFISLVVIYFILRYVPLYRKVRKEDTVEQQQFLKNDVEDTPESPPTMRHEDENIIEARKNDVQRKKLDEEKSAENASDLCIDSDKSDNEVGDKEELTDVFDDTVESLQRIAPPTDDQDREVCTELYNLLGTEGLKLILDVMAAIITRETGKSVKILLNYLTDQEKNILKVMLPEESHRILESKTYHDTSFYVLYGLHRIFFDKEKSPKSGWGNPVSGKNLGIGDDVERLYRILTIVQRISNPVTVSVENYIRLLDIMIEALTRLDPGAEFKEDFKLLSYKLESIKNPNLTKTILNKFTDIVKKLW